jgi:hypothetical protein
MTEQKQPSYTSRLIDNLKSKDIPDATLEFIREFAKSEAKVLEAQNKATEGMYRWGKFKGKLIRDVYKLDPDYVKWSATNKQYLRASEIEIIESLIA